MDVKDVKDAMDVKDVKKVIYSDYPSSDNEPSEIGEFLPQPHTQAYTPLHPIGAKKSLDQMNVKSFSELADLIKDKNFVANVLKNISVKPDEEFSKVKCLESTSDEYPFIAVKIINITSKNHRGILKEVNVLEKYFSKPLTKNLLKFIGTYRLENDNKYLIAIVSEALSSTCENLQMLLDSQLIMPNYQQQELLFNKILRTVQILHINNIIHGDIWAANIVLDKRLNKFLLIDFGDSCLIDDDALLKIMSCKTPGIRRNHLDYMPPYLLQKINNKQPFTPNDYKDLDIYALAATMYRLFSINHGPLIDISQYPTIHSKNLTERTNAINRFIKQLEENINNLQVGEPFRRQPFEQQIIKLLKSKKERDQVVFQRKGELDLNKLIFSKELHPELIRHESERLLKGSRKSLNLSRTKFLESQGSTASEGSKENEWTEGTEKTESPPSEESQDTEERLASLGIGVGSYSDSY